MSDIQPATLICTPLFHVTAEIPVFLQSFALGRKLVMMPKWNAEEAMRLIQDEQVNYFVGVPLMRSEEHTSELQSLMRISDAVFCLKKKHNTSEHMETTAY